MQEKMTRTVQVKPCFDCAFNHRGAEANPCNKCMTELDGTPTHFVGRQQAKPSSTFGAADILANMAETFRERGKVYKDNFRIVGPVMKVLHPDGVVLKDEKDHEFFHLYSLLIVKLTRFAISGLKHEDSIHDLCVYGAMLEAILKERNGNSNQPKEQ